MYLKPAGKPEPIIQVSLANDFPFLFLQWRMLPVYYFNQTFAADALPVAVSGDGDSRFHYLSQKKIAGLARDLDSPG